MSWFLLDRNLKLLEPYDWKLSRTVLRGKGAVMPPTYPARRWQRKGWRNMLGTCTKLSESFSGRQ